MSRALALAAALLAAAACSRTKQVRPEAEGPRQGAEPGQATGGRGGGIPARPGRPPVPAAPQGLLEKGVVARIQRALGDRGLLREHRDGELDAATNAAIRRFQERKGLAATGFPDRETLKDLGIDPESAYVRESDRKREEGKSPGQGGTGTAAGGGAERKRGDERGDERGQGR